MKIFALEILLAIFIHFHQVVQSKSLQNHHGNSMDSTKVERSLVANILHEQAVLKFQESLNQAKYECVRDMNMDASYLNRFLMFEERPTEQEKCLLMCLLKRTKFMEDNNKISAETVAGIAGALSENNPLVVSIAVATAINCNRFIAAEEPCEAAYQINKCIASALKAHKLKISY